MPIVEDVNVDLKFLILETKKQAMASQSILEKTSPAKIKKIKDREDHIENLKNTVIHKSYHHMQKVVDSKREFNYFKALIRIAASLERISDFFDNIADQTNYLIDVANIRAFDLKKYYNLIYKTLDIICPALMNHDLGLANKICDSEAVIDEYYKESFNDIRNNLRNHCQVDDMITLLFIIRYLERVGDAFLNIGEAMLDVHVGENLSVRQFKHLKHGLEVNGIDLEKNNLDFSPIMNTRSGCRVAKITNNQAVDGVPAKIFYKEGGKEKINLEAKGIDTWSAFSPQSVPRILYHKSHKKNSLLLLEHLNGIDLLTILLNNKAQATRAITLVTQALPDIWQKTKSSKGKKSKYLEQLISRINDVKSVHPGFSVTYEKMDNLIDKALKIEKKIKPPFYNLIHGDLNADNILVNLSDDRVYFVDVHRSTYGDYIQDISVFLISNYRVPVFSRDIRKRLNDANERMFETALEFANQNNDPTFHLRLGLGLLRSLVTSTRFILDEGFSKEMFLRGFNILNEIVAYCDKPDDFRISSDLFLHS